jgi:hypothetical protein
MALYLLAPFYLAQCAFGLAAFVVECYEVLV